MKIEIIEPEQAQEAIDWSKKQLLYKDFPDGSRDYIVSTGDHEEKEFIAVEINSIDFGCKFQAIKTDYNPAPKGTVIKITQE